MEEELQIALSVSLNNVLNREDKGSVLKVTYEEFSASHNVNLEKNTKKIST